MAVPIIPAVLALAQFAPSLMRFFGVGETSAAVVEKVVDVAKQVTGASNPEEAVAAMRANAEVAERFQMAVLNIDAELQKAYLADVASAREREVKIATSDAAPMINKVITPILALVVTLGGGVMLWYSTDGDTKMAVVGLMTLVLGYYFGTSQGSTKASQLFRDVIRKSGPPAVCIFLASEAVFLGLSLLGAALIS